MCKIATTRIFYKKTIIRRVHMYVYTYIVYIIRLSNNKWQITTITTTIHNSNKIFIWHFHAWIQVLMYRFNRQYLTSVLYLQSILFLLLWLFLLFVFWFFSFFLFVNVWNCCRLFNLAFDFCYAQVPYTVIHKTCITAKESATKRERKRGIERLT